METSAHVRTLQHFRAAGFRPLARILAVALVGAGCASTAPGRSAPDPAGDVGAAPADTVSAAEPGAAPVGRTGVAGSDRSEPANPATRTPPDSLRVEPAVAGLARLDSTMAAPSPSGEHAIGRLIADALRAAGRADVAIVGNDAIHAGLDAGSVTRAALLQAVPLRDRPIRLHLTGGQLREAVEGVVRGARVAAQVSGLTVWYDPARPAGSRVLTVELDGGEPVRGDRVYTVVVSEALAAGGDGFEVLRHALVREELGIATTDALAAYLRALPQPVHTPGTARLRAVDAGGGRR